MNSSVKDRLGISRPEALELIEQVLPLQNLRNHCLATEAIMRALAVRLGHDQELWGLAGLLHDLDYVQTKDRMDRHGLETERLLQQRGVCRELTDLIKSHNAGNLGLRRTQTGEHALVAAECITGLIVATALVYPDKKLASVKESSIIKRMKQKEFARSVNRDHIRECELIGFSLPDFAALSLQAMCGISSELGL